MAKAIGVFVIASCFAAGVVWFIQNVRFKSGKSKTRRKTN